MENGMIAVIMAGGKGTRIASLNAELPKPMIEINGKPILEHQIIELCQQNIRNIILVVGYLQDKIIDYFQNGEKWGVQIEYIKEDTPLGTAGSLFFLKGKIQEDFLLLNGDVIFSIDFERFYQFHKKKSREVTILTHPNDHPYDSGVIVTNKEGQAVRWITKEDKRMWYKNRVNAGIHFCSEKLLERLNAPVKKDLDRDILKQVLKEGKLQTYDSSEYIKDMGTPERYESVCRDFREGKVKAKNLKNKQKAIFLDRDGTINKYIGFLKNIDDFELIPGVAEAIKKINEAGYLAIVITNQPVIARGEVTEEELENIHNKMETILGEAGAYLDDIFYCPHHPHSGFFGERKELKMECDCRKPKPGLICKATEKYNIDLSHSYMIGDSDADILAGKAAGCRTYYIGLQTENVESDFYAKNLKDAIEKIFNT